MHVSTRPEDRAKVVQRRPAISAATTAKEPRPASLIARPALEERLDEAFGKRLTTIVAGAGYGKTTLLDAWSADLECARYTLSVDDRVQSTLARGITAALRARLPQLPEGHPALDAAGGREDDLVRAQAAAAVICEELAGAAVHDIVLVLDDVHALEAASASAHFLEALCRQAPPTLHVVLGSRTPPPFPVGRLRAAGALLELGAQALAFTPEEVADTLAAAVDDDAVVLTETVHAATGGWPAAVRLAAEVLRATPGAARPAALDRLRQPEGQLFSYLAAEVMGAEPDASRELLRRVAHLDSFTVELCERLGIAGAAAAIEALVHRSLFVQQHAGAAVYALHPLMREFVRMHWPTADGELADLHRLAAAWFESRGDHVGALRAAARAVDVDLVVRLIAAHGARMLADGTPDVLCAAAASLPEQPRLHAVDRILGEAHWVRGDWDAARRHLERAAAGEELLPAGVAWRIGAIHHLGGDPEAALRVYGRARVDGSEPDDEAFVLAWTASAHWMLGNVDACKAFGARAISAARATSNLQALATAHIALGVLAGMEADAAGHAHFQQALDAVEAVHDVLQEIRIRVNWQMPLHEEGRYGEALEQLERAIALAELTGFTFFHGLALVNRGETKLAMGLLDEAIGDNEAALAVFRSLESDWVAIAHKGLGSVYVERGDLALARASFESALAVAERSGEKQALIASLVGLARVVVHEDPDEAARLTERALSYGSWWGHVDALVGAGWVALARGDTEGAAGAATAALETARRRLNPAGIAKALELQALSAADPAGETGALVEALEIWRRLGNASAQARVELALARLRTPPDAAAAARAERRLRALGFRVDGLPPAGLLFALPPQRPAPLSIQALGSFRVVRDGEPIRAETWKSKKARDLLKLLVAQRGRPLSRHAAMEALWPGEDPAKLGNRLSVAASVARAVLDPDKRFPSGHFISGDQEALRLVREHIVIDVEDFIGEAESALSAETSARDGLEYAESLYRGDFLEDDAYADWAVPLREEARALSRGVLRALAEHAADAAEYDRAARYLLRMLERDAHDEDAHLELVRTLQRGGQPGEARRRYRTYTARMEEIGVEAAPYPAAGRAEAL